MAITLSLPLPILLTTLVLLSFHSQSITAQDFDFFYFVVQWPGSYCDTKSSCCYPTTGKPAANFGIHGLWPSCKDGSYPSNCNMDSPFDPSQIRDLRQSMQEEWPTLACPSGDGSKFWAHEWVKHGTCSEPILNQHSYFQTALSLKKHANILQILQDSRIEPDGGYYDMGSISGALRQGLGVSIGIECNMGESGTGQLYQIFLCVDRNVTNGFIDCPLLPRSSCSDEVEFPIF